MNNVSNVSCPVMGASTRQSSSAVTPGCLPQGCFAGTVMFYGYYTNSSLYDTCQTSPSLNGDGAADPAGCSGGDDAPQMSYNIPAAYFFTTGAAFFVTCIILVYWYAV